MPVVQIKYSLMAIIKILEVDNSNVESTETVHCATCVITVLNNPNHFVFVSIMQMF